MPEYPESRAPRSASSITCDGVRWVRVISRMDCCAKIGLIPPPARLRDSTCPGVARPVRSPKPKLDDKPSVTGPFIDGIETLSSKDLANAMCRIIDGTPIVDISLTPYLGD